MLDTNCFVDASRNPEDAAALSEFCAWAAPGLYLPPARWSRPNSEREPVASRTGVFSTGTSCRPTCVVVDLRIRRRQRGRPWDDTREAGAIRILSSDETEAPDFSAPGTWTRSCSRRSEVPPGRRSLERLKLAFVAPSVLEVHRISRRSPRHVANAAGPCCSRRARANVPFSAPVH